MITFIFKIVAIFNIFFIPFLIEASSKNLNSSQLTMIELPNKTKLITFILASKKEHKQGLSGILSKHFPNNNAALFLFKKPGIRRFWMRNTYFNLDIIFLNSKFKIIEVQRNMQAHPGKTIDRSIEKTKEIWAHHVLEIKSSSPIAKKLKKGIQLKLHH